MRVPIVIVNNVISEFRDGHWIWEDIGGKGETSGRRRAPHAIFAKTLESCAKHEATKADVNHMRMILAGGGENEGTYDEKFRIHFAPYDRPRASALSLSLLRLSFSVSGPPLIPPAVL